MALAGLAFAVLQQPVAALAGPAPVQTVVKPTSDGSVYPCGGCDTVFDGAYVLASGGTRATSSSPWRACRDVSRRCCSR